jgi:hypothetical protein
MDTIAMRDWSNYLTVMAGVAATLTGLIFVAVSINLSRILTVPGLTGRAAESMLQLLGVVAISTTALIPWQPPRALGIEILLLDFILWLIQTVLQIRYVRSKTGHPLRWAAVRIVQTQCASIPFCVAGVLLVRGFQTGMYWLTPGFIFSLVAGFANAWVLLVEILR